MGLFEFKRVRATYGKPFADKVQLPVTRELLRDMGECLVKHFSREAEKDFAKRGWSTKDPMGGPRIGDSFRYHIRGQSTLEITSSFYGMDVLGSQDLPEHKMTWLTQEAKEARPRNYHRTAAEGSRRVNKDRRPLVVPIKTKGGEVIFRTAPLTFNDAWVHPGIAKFTFVERAMKKGREECLQILGRHLPDLLQKGLRP